MVDRIFSVEDMERAQLNAAHHANEEQILIDAGRAYAIARRSGDTKRIVFAEHALHLAADNLTPVELLGDAFGGSTA